MKALVFDPPISCSVYDPRVWHTATASTGHSSRSRLQARSKGSADENVIPEEKDATTATQQQTMSATTTNCRRKQWRRRLRRTAISLALASSLWMRRPGTVLAAPAEKPVTVSLRPGMSREQAKAVEVGDVTVIQEIEQAPSVFKSAGTTTSTTTGGSSSGSKAKKGGSDQTKSKSAFDYYGDEDDDEEDDFLNDIGHDFSVPASQADKALAERLQSSTSDKFAARYQTKSKATTFKVGLAFFGPTYGFMIVREYVRRRREETYVKKGLEILKAQKAEYFNVTETTPDSDVEDALKNLKNKNSTKADDDDDDDDDDYDDDDDNDEDDDDDEPEPPRRRPPRKPLGNGPKGDGGAGSGSKSDDPGYGKPSDEDIDRLKRLYGNS